MDNQIIDVLVEMSRVSLDFPDLGDFDCSPFGFNLGEFAAEALHQQPKALSRFVEQADDGVMKDYVLTKQSWRS